MCAALDAIYDTAGFDAILLTRGGGSAEDLWAFNDEALARKIAESPIPLVSAVGHEIDFTITDFVADRRAPTPSAAAEMLSPDQRDVASQLLGAEQVLARQFRRHLKFLGAHLVGLQARLRHPGERLREQAQRLDDLDMRLRRAQLSRLRQSRHDLAVLDHRLRGQSPATRLLQLSQSLRYLGTRCKRAAAQRLAAAKNRADLLSARLGSLSPERTLERGYAIVLDGQGRLVQRAGQVAKGDVITTRLGSGELSSEVLEVREKDAGK